MISKISKGKGFRGLLMYVAGKQDAELIGGNVSSNPQDAAREMGALRQYSACKTPVWHCSLSLSPQDRHLTNEEFAELARKFLQKMGLEHNQYTVYRHTDKEHAHVHIVANRIDLSPEHKVWNAWRDIKRAREAKSELEVEYNLCQVPHNPQFARPEISRGQQEEARRTGTLPPKQYCAEAIANASKFGTVHDFIMSLRSNGIEAVPNISTTGKMNGFSFRFGKKHYKGSQLRCSWRELAPKLHYDAERDNEFLFSLVPEDKHPAATPTAEPKEPRRQYAIYTRREWEKMGGAKDSDYRRAYRMISSGYSLRDVAAELRLQAPNLTERQLERILYSAGRFWIERNREKVQWAYRPRRSIRFSNDPMIFLLEVLALLVGAAIKAGFRGIEEHRTRKQIDGIATELQEMAQFAEERAYQRMEREQAYEREERERENPLLSRALELSQERSR